MNDITAYGFLAIVVLGAVVELGEPVFRAIDDYLWKRRHTAPQKGDDNG